MGEKQDLAVLFSLLEKPTAEFIDSEPFRRLEQESDLIRHIEPFGLPEVKKLICCSSILADQKWAEKYSDARKLYDETAELDFVSLLMQFGDISEFEKRILACVDGKILGEIESFFKKIEAEKEKAKKERTALKGKVTKAKKKAVINMVVEEGNFNKDTTENIIVTDSVTAGIKTEDELRLDKLNKYIEEKEKFLKLFEKHASKTEDYLNQSGDLESMNIHRQQAYNAVDAIKPSIEEEFLIRFIHEAELLTGDAESLKNHGFLQRFIELLDKAVYKDIAFPVLAKLYLDNAIDLECNLIAGFITAHGKMLADYLIDQYLSAPNYLTDTENYVFLEYSIKGTIEGNTCYVTWWNTINKASDWKIILDIADEIVDESLLKIAVRLMHGVSGVSLNAFFELVQSEVEKPIGFTSAEFIIELIGQEAPNQRELIAGYIRSADQNIRKLQRMVALKDREINRHSQELFSSLYQPLEQLEELAVNLMLSDGEIECRLVAVHVINALADLRENLTALGLDTADDVEAWKCQTFLNYDPEKHRMPSKIGSRSDQVKLQTLGFTYTDDEGTKKIRAAEVYIPAPVEVHQEKNANVADHDKNWPTHSKDKPASNKKKGYPKSGSTNKKPKNSNQSQKGKKK